jgi:hypothetical protein
MKQTFGVKPAGSYSCWMLWTAGSHKKEKIGFGTDHLICAGEQGFRNRE